MSLFKPIYFFALKLLLGPILLWQGKRAREQALRLPDALGERSGMVSATGEKTPFRILVVGDSSAAGVGVGQQSQALACLTASALSKQLQRPVAWQVIAQSGVNTMQALALIGQSVVKTADVVVFSLGVNDVTTQVKAAAYIENTAALWQTVQGKTGAQSAVFCGLPPVHRFPALPQPLRFYLGQRAYWLDAALQAWISKQGQLYCANEKTMNHASVGDMASDGYHPGPRIYAIWAQQVADLIAQREGV
jgi:lysophospholipase L1-like esterase